MFYFRIVLVFVIIINVSESKSILRINRVDREELRQSQAFAALINKVLKAEAIQDNENKIRDEIHSPPISNEDDNDESSKPPISVDDVDPNVRVIIVNNPEVIDLYKSRLKETRPREIQDFLDKSHNIYSQNNFLGLKDILREMRISKISKMDNNANDQSRKLFNIQIYSNAKRTNDEESNRDAWDFITNAQETTQADTTEATIKPPVVKSALNLDKIPVPQSDSQNIVQKVAETLNIKSKNNRNRIENRYSDERTTKITEFNNQNRERGNVREIKREPINRPSFIDKPVKKEIKSDLPKASYTKDRYSDTQERYTKERHSNSQDRHTIKQDRPSNNQDRPSNNQDRPSNNQDRPSNNQDRPSNNQDRPSNDQDRPSNNQDRPSNNQDRPSNNQDRHKNNQDRYKNDQSNQDRHIKPKESYESPSHKYPDYDSKPKSKPKIKSFGRTPIPILKRKSVYDD